MSTRPETLESALQEALYWESKYEQLKSERRRTERLDTARRLWKFGFFAIAASWFLFSYSAPPPLEVSLDGENADVISVSQRRFMGWPREWKLRARIDPESENTNRVWMFEAPKGHWHPFIDNDYEPAL